jgi:hypothetical protein
MSKNNLSEEHDSYMNPVKNIGNGKAFSEEIALPFCHYCSEIARYKIFSEYNNTVLVCQNHYDNLKKSGKVKPVLKNYINEKLPLSHKIPDCRSVGIKSFSQFGNKKRKEFNKNNSITDFILAVIWDDREILGEECKIHGNTIPAIKIFYPINGEELYFFFTESGIPMFSTKTDGTFVEYYSGR